MKRSGFLKRNVGLKSRGFKTPKVKKDVLRPEKLTKAALWRLYELERPSSPRYEGRKGIYWHVLSQVIRIRDFKKYNGECIDQCGKFATDWHDFDAGHYVSAAQGGFGLLFDRTNVNGQLKGCNNPKFSPNSNIGYRFGLDKRYGEGTADALWNRRNEINKAWSELEYDSKIRDLQQELAHMQ